MTEDMFQQVLKDVTTYRLTLPNIVLTIFLMGFLTNRTLWGADLPPLVIWLSEDIFNILF